MLDIGFSELLFIAIIAIIFLGPERLPEAMVKVAKLFKQIKKYVTTAKDTLEEEMKISEIKQEAIDYKKKFEEANEELAKVKNLTNLDGIKTEFEEILNNDKNETIKREKVDFTKLKEQQDLQKSKDLNV
ncbi:MAG: Sec-independent protein translocase subunit TatB [Campylobacterales bacterium]|nr:Sec-independent protein translocase subunit TatB [Campylobacterales bacterium]